VRFLRGILEEAAATKTGRDKATQEIGDFYGACTIRPRNIASTESL
jgi:hypothetical protein